MGYYSLVNSRILSAVLFFIPPSSILEHMRARKVASSIRLKTIYAFELIKDRKEDGFNCVHQICYKTDTSNGVKGHLPSIRIAPGFITRPLLRNFPLQLLSRAISISRFSSSPPSYIQHENATISFNNSKSLLDHEKCILPNGFQKFCILRVCLIRSRKIIEHN